MTDDYLWDRTGRDADVERLETLLKPLAHVPGPEPRVSALPARPFPWPTALLAAAAAVLLAVGLVTTVRRATAGTDILVGAHEIDLGRYGSFRTEADARVRRLRQDDELIKYRLERGTLHASITADAKPRLFQVETPATTCIDLGCHYTLTVGQDGRTRVHVETGRVAFTDGPWEVYVPARGVCFSDPRTGSGTPHWDDSAKTLVDAIRAFDAAPGRASAAAVESACHEPHDTLTLWHFLQSDDAEVRALGLDALERRCGAPAGATREDTLARDADALHAWQEHAMSGFLWGRWK